MPDFERNPSRQRATAVFAVALSVVVVATWWNAFGGAFVWDDLANLIENRHLRSLAPTADLWTDPQGGLAGRPLVALSFALNYAVGKLDPWGYHLVNLAIHLAASWALFAVARAVLELPRSPPTMRESSTELAFAVALLWSVHPLHTAAVTYVVQRVESLMGLFFFGGLFAAVRSFTAARPAPWRVAAVAAGVCGAFCKEPIAALPLVAFLFDTAFVAGSAAVAWRERRGLYLAFLAVWIANAISIELGGSNRALAVDPHYALDLWSYLKIQARAIVHYLALAFWPAKMVLDYGRPIPRSVAEWLPQGTAVVALIAVALLRWKRAPRASAVALAFFCVLAPSSSFIVVPTEPMADQRMYVPLAALIALCVAGLERALAPKLSPLARRKLVLVLACVAASALAVRTVARNRDFADPLELARQDAASSPAHDRAWARVGQLLSNQGRFAQAREVLDRVHELAPEFEPYERTRIFVYTQLGAGAEAERLCAEALRRAPNDAYVRVAFGKLLLARGDAPGAEAEFRAALDVVEDDAGALCGLGRSLLVEGRAFEAVVPLERAMALEPSLTALEPLVFLRATASDARVRDVAAAERWVAMAWSTKLAPEPALARVRALTLAARGRFDEALALALPASELARRFKANEVADALERDSVEYRAHRVPSDVRR